ncbi:MAG: transcriptional regulator, partial [Bacteroidota bacterium]|nr:transcriptional regulator [Bacteroidota bacterium]
VSAYPASSSWVFLGVHTNQLIAQDVQNGLLQFSNGLWQPFIKGTPLPDKFIVSSILPFGKDSSLITTINTGFHILCNQTLSAFRFTRANPFSNQRILTATPITKDWIAVGTNLAGCYIINKKGEIIQNISRKEGLQINNILYLFVDARKNLWIGLDNGIDFIAYNNAIKHIYPEKLNEGEGYTSIIYENQLYVGTSNGLYKVLLSDKKDLSYVYGEFSSVPDTKGSAWGLYEVNNKLLMAHHDGAYKVEDDKVTPINTHTSYFNFVPFYSVQPSSLIVAGDENGLDFLEYKNNSFISKGNLPGFSELCQFAAVDNNNTIWIAHPYRGVYKVDVSNPLHLQSKLYTEKNGLPSYLNNHLFKIKNRIVITTEKGVYEYNARKDSFEPSDFYKPFFYNKNIRCLKEDPNGNIWFIEDKNLGVIDFSADKPKLVYFPQLNGKMVSGFEFVYPYNDYNIFVGSEKGFYHINYEEYKKNSYPTSVKISAVKALGRTDTLLFGGYYGDVNTIVSQSAKAIPQLANQWNSVHFEYASPAYENSNSVEYSFYLKGFDKDWSLWGKKSEKEYTNLPAGNYTFEVKARNNLSNESKPNSYLFIVLPPWYQTKWAYSFYILFLLVVVYTSYRMQKRMLLKQQQRHEEEQRKLLYLHQLEIDKSEKEIINLKNEKLETELEYKNSELASTALHLVQKGELLADIKDELVRIKKTSTERPNDDFKKILHILKEENKLDKDWEQFASHFDSVHASFLKILKQKHPLVSAHELKLCAYLRMNLSSKEIAQLENISVRGVEISRYRLRKKLQIPTETNLFDFLLQLSYDD